MKLLVTGSEGYIGTLLVPVLKARGHFVDRLDAMLFERCRAEREIAGAVIRRDVRDLSAGDLTGYDAVIHLAGLSNDPLGDLDPSMTFAINRDASVSLARNARDAGVPRFIFSSTCSVYGAQGDRWLTEASELNPITPYAVSKRDAEAAISALASDRFDVVHLRHGTAYGYSPMIRFDLVVNNLVAWALATGIVHLKSDGNAWRPLVHVADIAAAFVASVEAESSAVSGRIFNIGRNEDNIRVIDLARMIASLMPDCRIERAVGAGRDLRSYRVDCSAAAAHLPGFAPEWTLQRGIADLVSRVEQFNPSPETFEGPRFSRIAHLKSLLSGGQLDAEFRWTRGVAPRKRRFSRAVA